MTSVANIRFRKYVLLIKEHLNKQAAVEVVKLLSLRLPSPDAVIACNGLSLGQIQSITLGILEEPWSSIILHHLQSLQALEQGNDRSLFSHQVNLIKAFEKILDKATKWCLPLLYSMISSLLKSARIADSSSLNTGEGELEAGNEGCLEQAGLITQQLFSKCLTDQSKPINGIDVSRRWAVYRMACRMFYINIKRQLNQIHNYEKVLKAIQNAKTPLPSLEFFPKSHQVEYRFYLGLLAFLQDDYSSAEENLEFAYKNCLVNATSHQERILQYLIPARALRGVLPSAALLSKHPKLAAIYQPLLQALRAQNPGQYSAELSLKEPVLIKMRTFTAFQRLTLLALRALVKKIWRWNNGHKLVNFQTLQTALKLCQYRDVFDEQGEMDRDAVEGVVITLIGKGYIKGIIGQSSLVLSVKNPFPKINPNVWH